MEVDPRNSKIARASLATRAWEAGDVYLPPAALPWVQAFKDELLSFPRGRHDDQVDAMSQALARVLDNAGADLETAMARIRGMLDGGGAGALGWLGGFRL